MLCMQPEALRIHECIGLVISRGQHLKKILINPWLLKPPCPMIWMLPHLKEKDDIDIVLRGLPFINVLSALWLVMSLFNLLLTFIYSPFHCSISIYPLWKIILPRGSWPFTVPLSHLAPQTLHVLSSDSCPKPPLRSSCCQPLQVL